MLTLKTSVAAAILAGSIGVTAGITYVATVATAQVTVKCPSASVSASDNRGIPLGGPPLPTNEGKRW